jgi:hypothetical protein
MIPPLNEYRQNIRSDRVGIIDGCDQSVEHYDGVKLPLKVYHHLPLQQAGFAQLSGLVT